MTTVRIKRMQTIQLSTTLLGPKHRANFMKKDEFVVMMVVWNAIVSWGVADCMFLISYRSASHQRSPFVTILLVSHATALTAPTLIGVYSIGEGRMCGLTLRYNSSKRDPSRLAFAIASLSALC